MLAIVALVGALLMAGCRSEKDNGITIGEKEFRSEKDNGITIGENRTENFNAMDLEEVERLPEEMKEDPLNKTLEETRDFRRNHYSEEDGNEVKIGVPDQDLPDQTKNRPGFSYDELYDIFNVIQDYVENTAAVPRRGYGYDIAQCIDPRMNAIYDGEDKGVAAGYENENIFIAEYETAKDSVYSYLVLVRDSKEGSWKIIHDGLNYKKSE